MTWMSHIFKLKQNWISGSTSHKRLSKWEETTCSFEWTIFLLDGCPSRSSSRLYSFFSIYNNELPLLFIIIIMCCSLTTRHYFLQWEIQMLGQIRSIMIYITLIHGLTIRKRILILVLVKKNRRSYLAVK